MRLGVNVDHIATLRQARRGSQPDPVSTARQCEQAGATSIVCHLREDRRHIQDADVRRLKRSVTTWLNLEMAMAKPIIEAALAVRPEQVTLVPERRRELTTEGGLDVCSRVPALQRLVRTFHARRIEVSLFVDPSPRHIMAAARTGARIIELHTGAYANARTPRQRSRALRALRGAARMGRALGLSIAAGHGLDYENVAAVAQIPEIEEVNIGFAIVARALEVGLSRAVHDMAACLRRARKYHAR